MIVQQAIFGAGCFWGVEEAFRKIQGVVSTAVGYMGGTLQNPTYEDVCSGKTGHAEVVHLEFDPSVISYDNLLDIFWKIHDPTTLNQQGPDTGIQYRSVIFYINDEQKRKALASKKKAQDLHLKKIVTEVTKAGPFWRAEEYHQKYIMKTGRSCH